MRRSPHKRYVHPQPTRGSQTAVRSTKHEEDVNLFTLRIRFGVPLARKGFPVAGWLSYEAKIHTHTHSHTYGIGDRLPLPPTRYVRQRYTAVAVGNEVRIRNNQSGCTHRWCAVTAVGQVFMGPTPAPGTTPGARVPEAKLNEKIDFEATP